MSSFGLNSAQRMFDAFNVNILVCCGMQWITLPTIWFDGEKFRFQPRIVASLKFTAASSWCQNGERCLLPSASNTLIISED